MTSFSPFLRRATACAIIIAAPATAQDQTIRGLEKFSLQPSAPTPTPTPSPAATPVPVPSAPRLALPVPTPTPSATPTPAAARPVIPRSTSAARPTPTPAPAATPSVAASPAPTAAAPAPLPPQTPTPVPTATAPVTTADSIPEAGDWTPWLIGGVIAVAIAIGAWLLLRRRRERDEPEPVYEPIAEPPPPPSSLQRGRIVIAMRPIKAGLNLLSATVESEITLTNTGDAPAHGIRLDVRLLSAHAGQDVELAAIAALPVERLAVPVFALAAGEERRVRAVAALPRDAVRAMTAGGRTMFVPLVAVNVIYDAGQTHQAFAIGVTRDDSAKLAPFWLDGPPRTFDTVAARPHAPAVER